MKPDKGTPFDTLPEEMRLELSWRIGGEAVYIPRRTSSGWRNRRTRDQEIRDQYHLLYRGGLRGPLALRVLAERYRCSTRTIRRAVLSET